MFSVQNCLDSWRGAKRFTRSLQRSPGVLSAADGHLDVRFPLSAPRGFSSSSATKQNFAHTLCRRTEDTVTMQVRNWGHSHNARQELRTQSQCMSRTEDAVTMHVKYQHHSKCVGSHYLSQCWMMICSASSYSNNLPSFPTASMGITTLHPHQSSVTTCTPSIC